MSVRGVSLASKRRLLAIGLTVTGLVAVIAVGAVVMLHPGTAHGSGVGGGGCFPTSGPACSFKGNSAFTNFNGVSDDGCIYTQAQVAVFESLTHPGNTSTQTVFIYYSKWDACNGVPLVEAFNADPNTGASTFNGSIQFGTNLSTATVNGTALMYDQVTGAPLFTTTINLTLKAYGPSTKSSDSQHFHAPGYVMNSHFSGTSRSAEVSGTFTDDAGNNLAAQPSLYAELENSSGGTVQLFKQ